jgi:hypothetical protein
MGRAARQVICSVRESLGKYSLQEFAPYVEPPSDKALEALLGEYLLI